MNKVIRYRRLSILAAAICLTSLIVMIFGVAGCSADQGLKNSLLVHDVTTQPVVQGIAASIPYGAAINGIVTLVSLLAAAYFKSQQSSAQAHLDTAMAATGTSTNAQATAALVNNLDTTPVSASGTPLATGTVVVAPPLVAPTVPVGSK